MARHADIRIGEGTALYSPRKHYCRLKSHCLGYVDIVISPRLIYQRKTMAINLEPHCIRCDNTLCLSQSSQLASRFYLETHINLGVIEMFKGDKHQTVEKLALMSVWCWGVTFAPVSDRRISDASCEVDVTGERQVRPIYVWIWRVGVRRRPVGDFQLRETAVLWPHERRGGRRHLRFSLFFVLAMWSVKFVSTYV